MKQTDEEKHNFVKTETHSLVIVAAAISFGTLISFETTVVFRSHWIFFEALIATQTVVTPHRTCLRLWQPRSVVVDVAVDQIQADGYAFIAVDLAVLHSSRKPPLYSRSSYRLRFALRLLGRKNVDLIPTCKVTIRISIRLASKVIHNLLVQGHLIGFWFLGYTTTSFPRRTRLQIVD